MSAKAFNTELMLELASENPFLPRFYTDPKSVALPTQLFFYYYSMSPLLIVNTNDFDFSDNERNFGLLFEHINQFPPGKHYFNPEEL